MIVKVFKYKCPCGWILLGESEGDLLFCDWIIPSSPEALTQSQRRFIRLDKANFVVEKSDLINEVIRQLDEYFISRRELFELPLRFFGTDFQKKVWKALTAIPYGETASYADIAGKIDRPQSVRAVANAIGANPFSIIVPCHRVIGTSGSLTGYAGGLPAKKILLSLERPSLFNETH